jgi:pimeloyl-ACP methyl ester carboxylesterase
MKKILLILVFILLQCSTTRTDFVVKEFSNLNLKLIEYPRIRTLIPRKKLPSVILYEPVLLTKSSLFRVEEDKEKGLIPFLNQEGYDVYVAFNEYNHTAKSKFKEPDLNSHGLELEKIIERVVDQTENKDVILGGLSVGGQAVLSYLSLPTKENSKIKIQKIFFLGTGIDYSYPNSFTQIVEKNFSDRGFIDDGCRTTGDNFCSRFIIHGNSNQDINNLDIYKKQKASYANFLPYITKFSVNKIDEEKLKIPMFIAYGKIDGVSPEESIYPLVEKLTFENYTRWERTKILFKELFTKYKRPMLSKVLELSEANRKSIDYDHFDLFLYEEKRLILPNKTAEKEVYYPLVRWLKQ